MIGKTFDRLVVVGGPYVVRSGGRNRKKWDCECACGVHSLVDHWQLVSGKTRSCGCLQRERASVANKNRGHGESRKAGNTAEYRIWRGIINRCCNRNDKAYGWYGARGIRVCDAWLNSYEIFLSDVGRRPSAGHSLDRIDNNGNYEPGNIRWATWKQQNRNSRNNLVISHGGRSMCITEWAEATGIPATALYLRAYAGWTPERIVTTPLRGKAAVNAD